MAVEAQRPVPEGAVRPKAPSAPPKKPRSGCVCDCEKNHGKGCKNSKAYLSGGCK